LHYLRPLNLAGYACAMQKYAAYTGQLNTNGRGYRMQKLQGGDHSALGDCAATLRLIQHMADW
jgi:DNA polymerase-3 subunit epsilon